MSELSSVDEETHSSDDEADDPKDTATERSEALFHWRVCHQPATVCTKSWGMDRCWRQWSSTYRDTLHTAPGRPRRALLLHQN